MTETTIQQGDKYEELVASYLKDLYSQRPGVFIYCKKKYPQRIQGASPLEIDISIEEKIYAERPEPYDRLTIIECKNHKNPVKRDVIDHLIMRKEDVRANDAICFSTSGFQKGAIEKAKDAGVKLAILDAYSLSTKWLTRRNNNLNTSNSIGGLLKKLGLIQSTYHSVFNREVYEGGEIIHLLDRLHPLFFSSVPYISQDKIEYLALKTLEMGGYNGCINPEFFCTVINLLEYRIEINPSLIKCDILALCDFQNRVVRLSQISSLPRLAFTLAHEIGHILLHQRLFYKNGFGGLEDTESNLRLTENNASFKSQHLEVQANNFAAYLLMPRLLLMNEWQEFKQEERIYKNTLYLDSQKVNREIYQDFVRKVNTVTTVSAEALRHRLKDLGILTVEDNFWV